jgi:hypothetical protein
MKKKYYVSTIAQSNGDHEVHAENCTYFPKLEHRLYLGEHDTCATAVTEAKRHYSQTNGCYYCSNVCHTQ